MQGSETRERTRACVCVCSTGRPAYVAGATPVRGAAAGSDVGALLSVNAPSVDATHWAILGRRAQWPPPPSEVSSENGAARKGGLPLKRGQRRVLNEILRERAVDGLVLLVVHVGGDGGAGDAKPRAPDGPLAIHIDEAVRVVRALLVGDDGVCRGGRRRGVEAERQLQPLCFVLLGAEPWVVEDLGERDAA
eukprot:6204910-Pleurochrysis_carterae.AAC.7